MAKRVKDNVTSNVAETSPVHASHPSLAAPAAPYVPHYQRWLDNNAKRLITPGSTVDPAPGISLPAPVIPTARSHFRSGFRGRPAFSARPLIARATSRSANRSAFIAGLRAARQSSSFKRGGRFWRSKY